MERDGVRRVRRVNSVRWRMVVGEEERGERIGRNRVVGFGGGGNRRYLSAKRRESGDDRWRRQQSHGVGCWAAEATEMELDDHVPSGNEPILITRQSKVSEVSQGPAKVLLSGGKGFVDRQGKQPPELGLGR